MNAILECNRNKGVTLEKMCTIMFTIIIFSVYQINGLIAPTNNQTLANATNSVKDSIPSISSNITEKKDKLFELYKNTLLNFTNFPFLHGCPDLIETSNNNKQTIACILYYDMLDNLNKTDVHDFDTIEKIKKVLAEYDSNQTSADNFCNSFGNDLSTDYESNMFEKTLLTYERRLSEYLKNRTTCGTLCHDFKLGMKLKILPICELISGGYGAIKRHLEAKGDNVEVKKSEIKTSIDNKSINALINTSSTQHQVVQPIQPVQSPVKVSKVEVETKPAIDNAEEASAKQSDKGDDNQNDQEEYPPDNDGENPDDDDLNEQNSERLLKLQKPVNKVEKETNIKTSISSVGNDLDAENADSNFFSYFMFLMFISVVFYIIYHNKTKVLALLLEGRRSRNGRSRRKPHSTEYRKLESNLEEAIQSNNQVMNQQIIY